VLFLAEREAGMLDQVFMAGEGSSYHDPPGRLSRIFTEFPIQKIACGKLTFCTCGSLNMATLVRA